MQVVLSTLSLLSRAAKVGLCKSGIDNGSGIGGWEGHECVAVAASSTPKTGISSSTEGRLAQGPQNKMELLNDQPGLEER